MTWWNSPVAETNAHSEVMTHKTVGQVADHFDEIVRSLKRTPAVLGHSFGGLLAQILAGRGLSAATVAIDPAPLRGVLPLPLSALKSAWPVIHNPANRNRAIRLTFEQFRFGFANAISEERPGNSTRNSPCRLRRAALPGRDLHAQTSMERDLEPQ